jgi:hypothetical protein
MAAVAGEASNNIYFNNGKESSKLQQHSGIGIAPLNTQYSDQNGKDVDNL